MTYAEVLTGGRLGRHDEKRVRGFFTDLISEILPIDAAVADKAADLRSRRKSLRMPDALILATAELHPDANLIVIGDQAVAKVAGSGFKVKLLKQR
jgi:predicted nucleic acid-binding protein